MPLLPRVSPGSRRLLGALALTAGWCGAPPPPALAEPPSPSSENQAVEERSASVEAPRIVRVRCVKDCPTPAAAAPGAKVRVVGVGFDGVSRIVFTGAEGREDDVAAAARPLSDRSVVVVVPADAVSGPLAAVAAGLRSRPSRPLAIVSSSSDDGNGTEAEPERRESGGRDSLVAPLRGAFGFGQAGARFGASREGRSHEGQDLIAACGTPVVAAGAGVISRSASHALAGNYVVVDGSTGDHAYMHLQSRSPLRVGARVRAGQVLGAVGTTGNARGCHLHFELWTEPGYRKGGRPVDPLPFLRGARGG